MHKGGIMANTAITTAIRSMILKTKQLKSHIKCQESELTTLTLKLNEIKTQIDSVQTEIATSHDQLVKVQNTISVLHDANTI